MGKNDPSSDTEAKGADVRPLPAARELPTIEETAEKRGHVNTFSADSPPQGPVDPYAQRGFILDMVRVHRGWGIGQRVSEADYDKAAAEVLGIPMGEQITTEKPATEKEPV